MAHLEHDRLVQLGVDGRAGADRAAAAHLAACAECSASLAEITRTVQLTAGSDSAVRIADPPDDVWARIAAAASDGADAARTEPRRSRRAGWIVAAAAVGCLVGSGVTLLLGPAAEDEPPARIAEPPAQSSAPSAPPPDTLATAALSVPDGPGGASGTARLVTDGGRWALEVDAAGLVANGGYFEVWLQDDRGRMYALGALTGSSATRLHVPGGISLSEFDIVDISAQRFNGDPSHSKDSVLRGTLRG